MRGGFGGERRQPLRLGGRVVVEKHEPVAARFARARVVPFGEPQIGSCFDDTCGGPALADQRCGTVRRSVVDDDDVEGRGVALRAERIQACGQPAPPVVGEDDDGCAEGHPRAVDDDRHVSSWHSAFRPRASAACWTAVRSVAQTYAPAVPLSSSR
jgi:hypothetical protein